MLSRAALALLLLLPTTGCDSSPDGDGSAASRPSKPRKGETEPKPAFHLISKPCSGTLRDRQDDGFSAVAVSLSDSYAEDPCSILIPSPDGRSKARVWNSGQGIFLSVSGAIGTMTRALASGPNNALGWAPDSTAFFVTINDGGLVGSYLVSVVERSGDRLRIRDLTPLVTRRFGHPMRCFDPEDPNVAGIAWLGSSRRLLVAAEILPHSNCDSMGTFKAYVVDPRAETIVAELGQLETKRRYRRLIGPELRNAEDECVIRPRTCYVPQLHPELYVSDKPGKARS